MRASARRRISLFVRTVLPVAARVFDAAICQDRWRFSHLPAPCRARCGGRNEAVRDEEGRRTGQQWPKSGHPPPAGPWGGCAGVCGEFRSWWMGWRPGPRTTVRAAHGPWPDPARRPPRPPSGPYGPAGRPDGPGARDRPGSRPPPTVRRTGAARTGHAPSTSRTCAFTTDPGPGRRPDAPPPVAPPPPALLGRWPTGEPVRQCLGKPGRAAGGGVRARRRRHGTVPAPLGHLRPLRRAPFRATGVCANSGRCQTSSRDLAEPGAAAAGSARAAPSPPPAGRCRTRPAPPMPAGRIWGAAGTAAASARSCRRGPRTAGQRRPQQVSWRRPPPAHRRKPGTVCARRPSAGPGRGRPRRCRGAGPWCPPGWWGAWGAGVRRRPGS